MLTNSKKIQIYFNSTEIKLYSVNQGLKYMQVAGTQRKPKWVKMEAGVMKTYYQW